MVAAALLVVPAMAADETLIYSGSLACVIPAADTTIDGDKVEAAVLDADHDVNVDGQTIGDISQTPLLFSGNYHVPTSGSLDVCVGTTLGYRLWGDLKVDNLGSVNTDGEFTYGINSGVDLPLKGNWAFTAGLRYPFQEADAEDAGGEIDVNPFVLRAGIAYRF